MHHGTIAINAYTILLVFSLVLGILAIPPLPSRFNLLAASWCCFLLAVFFSGGGL